MRRKYNFGRLYKQVIIDGHPIYIAYFDDLTDAQLQEHFNAALNREDYEYLDELKAEAQKRNIILKTKKV